MIADARQAIADPAVEIMIGADKGYDAREFIDELQRRVPPASLHELNQQPR